MDLDGQVLVERAWEARMVQHRPAREAQLALSIYDLREEHYTGVGGRLEREGRRVTFTAMSTLTSDSRGVGSARINEPLPVLRYHAIVDSD